MKPKEDTKLDANPIFSIVLLLIGLATAAGAYRIGLGAFHEPGPGFLPFFAGISAAFFALLSVVASLKKGWLPLQTRWKGTQWHLTIVVVVSLLLFSIFLTRLGFLLSSFILMTVFFRLSYKPKWWVTILTSLATVTFFYILFKIWLETQLPSGFLGF